LQRTPENDLCDRSVTGNDALDNNTGAMAGKMESDIGAWFFAVLGTSDPIDDQDRNQ
jgi:hypothetical protein